MSSKLIGSILLIAGTSIGAGMLGLPIASAELGFVGSVLLLIGSWFVMLSGAFLLLEANLYLPEEHNLISMAKITIGPTGQAIAWVTYLLLLYSLLCAYIAGGTDLFQHILVSSNIHIANSLSAILFTLIFGSIVYCGIQSVDRVNRLLMTLKFSSFFLLIAFMLPYGSVENLSNGHLSQLLSVSAMTVTLSAFGWATLIPTLRVYFKSDIKKLKIAIFVGATIPLICYIMWDAIIMGVLPYQGTHSLLQVLQSSNPTSALVSAISGEVLKNSVTLFTKAFTSVCVLTSFLGVALCLTDFFADGLQLEKKGSSHIFILLITFVPALLVAIYFPHIFIKALSYAGIYSLILLIILPAWMVWQGRYQQKLTRQFTVPGGKLFLLFLVTLSLCIIGFSV